MKFLLYLLRRLVWLIPVVMVVILVVFVVFRILPGDPVFLMVGPQDATDEVIARVRQEMGLDQPVLMQYGLYIQELLRGDLGTAWHTGNPVTKDIMARFPATLELAIAALLLSILMGVPLGVTAAVHKDSLLDHAVRVLSLGGLSVPSFWFGLVLVYFLAFSFRLLPSPMGRIAISVAPPQRVTGLYVLDAILTGNAGALVSSLRHIILPAVTLALGQVAGITRMVRATMIEVLNSDYVRAEWANGVPDRYVYYKYALKNTLIPTITYIGNGSLWLLGGSVVVEIVFSWPGLGLYAVNSIFMKDYVGVQGVAFLMAMLAIFVYLAVDILYFVVDPRIEY